MVYGCQPALCQAPCQLCHRLRQGLLAVTSPRIYRCVCLGMAQPQVPKDPQTGRHAAYVALHGHGVYPRPGRVLRHFFLGNDLCSAAGPVWRPRQVILLPSAPLLPAGTASITGALAGAVSGSSHVFLLPQQL